MISNVKAVQEVLSKAKKAKEITQAFFPTTEQKNEVLFRMAEYLEANTDKVIQANQMDLSIGKQQGVSSSILDRIALNEERIADIAQSLREVVSLSDPIGETLESFERPNGLRIKKIRVPLGVIGMIYESRPNVTVDAAALCLKTGNATILRGGSTAIHSNKAIIGVLHEAMQSCDFPTDYVQLLENTDRASVEYLLKCKEYVDVIIPRGGRSLIQYVVQNAIVPYIETGEGLCHVYLHAEADPQKALPIIINAKCQRPSVCNAIESVLIDRSFAEQHLSSITGALQQQGVTIKGCMEAKKIVPEVVEAAEEDWATEYLDYELSIKVVQGIDEALEHIKRYGTKHSESIVTENEQAARTFLERVDAAAVYHNASTRFTDGGAFGFGAEIGISTQKLHARGPMALRELTSSKYCIYGSGQIRE